VIVVLILNSLFTVPAAYALVLNRFGGRVSFVCPEGLNFKLPFIDSAKNGYLHSLKLKTMRITFFFFSKDKRKMELKALIRYQTNPHILNRENLLPRMIDVDQNEITDGLRSKVESVIGKLGRTRSWEDFHGNSVGVEYYLWSVLGLIRPIHVRPREFFEEKVEEESVINFDKDYPGLLEKLDEYLPENSNEVSADRRLEFYKEFSGPIGEVLRAHQNLNVFSKDEEAYGIDVLEFTLEELGVTETTEKAMESDRNAKVISTAVRRTAREILDDLPGVSPQRALTSAEAASGVAEQTNYVVEGGEHKPLVLLGKGA
ncbi:MAG TPA: hypothetical protein ENH86_01820, partial [Candidatus Jorgensenbacteria bacterium]|nr:hypothetical protein [Candidatus Jorgensenbacteria bacterium]